MKINTSTRFISAILCILAILGLLSGCTSENEASPTETATAPTETEAPSEVPSFAAYKDYSLTEDIKVKNIILMIGDGMGENIITNAEIVKGDKMAMKTMPVKAMVNTNSLDGVTDSAAASTAISCGVKTKNEYIGVDETSKPVETIVEFAKARGLKTGIVTTQLLSHATPAGMAAHYNSRSAYNVLLKQMVNIKTDVLLGGGEEYTRPEKMQKRLADNGYTYISTYNELVSGSLSTPLIGTFAYSAMPAGTLPSLTDMSDTALKLLDGGQGFFLMIEGSYIDARESEGDMAGTIKEMQCFDKCVDFVLGWAEKHPGTLVIVTADHETGGVQVPENKTPENVTDALFTSNGEHTDAKVPLFAAGAQASALFTKDEIDNTEISQIMRKALNDTYGEKPENIMSE